MPAIAPFDPLRLIGGARSLAAAAQRAIRADHATLNQRSVRSCSAPMTHAFLYAGVAPARRVRRPSRDFGVLASALASRLNLPPLPHLASAQMQRFVALDQEGSYARSLEIRTSGMVELLWALVQLPTPDGAWALDASEACRQLAAFASLIGSDEYARLLGRSRLARRHGRRVDWVLAVTVTSRNDGSGRGWRDIIAPGHALARATGHEFGFMPPAPYGASRLRNVRRSESPRAIVTVLLEEWLLANGYLDVDTVVPEITAAAAEAVQ